MRVEGGSDVADANRLWKYSELVSGESLGGEGSARAIWTGVELEARSSRAPGRVPKHHRNQKRRGAVPKAMEVGAKKVKGTRKNGDAGLAKGGPFLHDTHLINNSKGLVGILLFYTNYKYYLRLDRDLREGKSVMEEVRILLSLIALFTILLYVFRRSIISFLTSFLSPL